MELTTLTRPHPKATAAMLLRAVTSGHMPCLDKHLLLDLGRESSSASALHVLTTALHSADAPFCALSSCNCCA